MKSKLSLFAQNRGPDRNPSGESRHSSGDPKGPGNDLITAFGYLDMTPYRGGAFVMNFARKARRFRSRKSVPGICVHLFRNASAV